jgi:transcriptional regulator with XRE-family HTH domain
VDKNFEILVKLLSENVRRERVARGISQEQLALSADVDRTYVSQIEREIANPSMKTLCQIAAALQVA